MNLINVDRKKGYAKLKIDNLDDLWYLSHIIEKGDLASSVTTRKIKLGEGSDDRKIKIIKKKIKLQIYVEKIQFSEAVDALRISGTIAQGHEDIAAGDYHTLSLEPGLVIELIKPNSFLEFQIKKLKDASLNKGSKVIICSLDREKAYFTILKKYGYEILSTLNSDLPKKRFDEKSSSQFYSEISKRLKEYIERYNLSKIIIGCPSFWKQDIRLADSLW